MAPEVRASPSLPWLWPWSIPPSLATPSSLLYPGGLVSMCVGSPHPCFVYTVVSRGRATTASGISLLPGWMGHPSCPSVAGLPAGGTFVQLVLLLSVLGSLAFSAGGGSLGRRQLGWQARWPWTSPLSYSSFLSPQGARPRLSPAGDRQKHPVKVRVGAKGRLQDPPSALPSTLLPSPSGSLRPVPSAQKAVLLLPPGADFFSS